MKKIILCVAICFSFQVFFGAYSSVEAQIPATDTDPKEITTPPSNEDGWGARGTDVNCDNLGWAGVISGQLGYNSTPAADATKAWRRPHKPMSDRSSNENGNTDDGMAAWRIDNKRHSTEYGEAGEFTAFHQTAKCRTMTTYHYSERIFYIYAGLGLAGLALLAYIGKWEWKWFFSFIGGIFVVAAMQALVMFLN
ncbi:MAG: hypothetical protein ACTSXQ_01645 [Alphaproteobacteria bacterium]